MTAIVPEAILWWITCVDIPLIGAMTALILRFRREMAHDLSEQARKTTRLNEILADFKLEVAKNYASLCDLKDTESRLIAHLLRIEAKLDQTALKTASMDYNRKGDDHHAF